MPGFLVTYKPLINVDPKKDTVIFFSIKGKSEADALAVVKKIRTMTQEHFNMADITEQRRENNSSFGSRFNEALEIKPRLFGVALDLRKLIR